ncbi:unnamed protein product [Trifolium pratense]|uniref:Uncharacterized protein n=1 Tax=Trifolium pratense TaxID=57577 RepID=A0ACB0LNW4_TRIPR|nr:unnamed protein product [Trifolium pratense]
MAAVWWIWRARNAFCLDNDLVPHFSLKMRIVDYALLLKNCDFNQHETTLPKLMRWNAFGGTDMILNVDGCSIGNPGISNFGGLIRNADGAWIHGFFAITFVTEPVDVWHHYAAIINNIKDILNRDWQVVILHTFREGNVCADYFAKLGANSNEVFPFIANPPAGHNLCLLADASGICFYR